MKKENAQTLTHAKAKFLRSLANRRGKVNPLVGAKGTPIPGDLTEAEIWKKKRRADSRIPNLQKKIFQAENLMEFAKKEVAECDKIIADSKASPKAKDNAKEKKRAADVAIGTLKKLIERKKQSIQRIKDRDSEPVNQNS